MMKFLLVYVGQREEDGATTFGNTVVETNHRRLRAEHRPEIEKYLKEIGVINPIVLNWIRVKDW